ncbi:phosphoribosylglycinamide formyltransferase [Alkalihalobacterium alkalinitrilicum]|uniref:phosphoribosylglycinamide formyltransferase n=1 Tax=Alkalihalobacterium alkalinitrilicum TaxID=427920 RepID=UPI0009959341|nr:phosphoribosylglycinamide formyltransferase [Alkalihalobacterium alkalinitrilicum]
MKNIAVFASGSGSNFQAIINEIERGELSAHIALLVCDKSEAKAIERAKSHEIDTFVFNPNAYVSKEEFEQEIVDELQTRNIEFIVLAGYMRLIGTTLLRSFEGKIVNIHPSLLPSFPGKDAIGQALLAGVKVTGVTIHYVDEGMDTGQIIAQEAVSVDEDETRETLTTKIQQVEHRLYYKTLKDLLSK